MFLKGVLEEVLVVEKRLVLKEELRITRRRVEERNPQRVTLRSEEVSVGRFGGRSNKGKTTRGSPGRLLSRVSRRPIRRVGSGLSHRLKEVE